MGASGNRNAAVFAPDRWRQTLRNLLLCLPLSSSSSFSHAVFWEGRGGGAEREAFFMLDQLLSSAIITFFE